jgi:hypothetical protein
MSVLDTKKAYVPLVPHAQIIMGTWISRKIIIDTNFRNVLNGPKRVLALKGSFVSTFMMKIKTKTIHLISNFKCRIMFQLSHSEMMCKRMKTKYRQETMKLMHRTPSQIHRIKFKRKISKNMDSNRLNLKLEKP